MRFPITQRGLRPVTAAGCLILAIGLTGPALANSRDSILERHGSWNAFVDRWKAFAANDIRLIDFQECRDPADNKTWYVGVWRPAKGGYGLFRLGNWKAFTDDWKKQADEKLRLADFSDGPEGNTSVFTGVYRGSSKPHALYRLSDWSAMVTKWKDMRKKGLRLIDLDETRRGNTTWFTGVWRQGSGSEALYRYGSWTKFVDRWKSLSDQNRRLLDIGVSRSGGKTWFSGIWRAGSGNHALHRFDSWPGILSKWIEIDNNGNSFAKLRDIECWQEGGKMHYVGVWR